MDSKEGRRRFDVWSIAVLLITALFVITSTGKLFDLSAFVKSIHNITSFSDSLSSKLAVVVIAAEFIGGGILLLPRYRLLGFSFLLTLLAIFSTVMFVTVMAEREIDCQCFGIWSIHFSNRTEITIDIVLFDLLTMLLLNELRRRDKRVSLVFPNKSLFLTITSAILLLQATIVTVSYAKRLHDQSIGSIAPVVQSLERKGIHLNEREVATFVFMLYYGDFNCPLCLDDFLSLCDSLQAPSRKEKARVVAFFHNDSLSLLFQDSVRISRWAIANSISFPVFLGPDSLFRQLQVSKSTIIVLDNEKRVLFLRVIPIGESKRNELLSYVTQ